MVFHPPSWVPELPFNPPDSIPIAEFMRNEKYGRRPVFKSRNPYICGLTGQSYSLGEVSQRSESFARALSEKLGWIPNQGSCWDKVVSLFSLNGIDYIPIAYGVHRLSGIVTPANVVFSAEELEHQLRSSGSKALITCVPLLEVALKAAKAAGIPERNIFILDLPGQRLQPEHRFSTIKDLISRGQGLPGLEPLKWSKGQGARQPAFLCYSSGTSGLPKAVMISHCNMIANILQQVTYESVGRAKKGVETQNLLAPLPMSHIYALIMAAHTTTWRGDSFVILPKYDFDWFLKAIQKFKIQHVLVVPPILVQMLRAPEICTKYDLSSIRFVYSGAAPLGEETIQEIEQLYPEWTIGQAYGMTETAVLVTSPSEHDIMKRASGSLLPGDRIKIMNTDDVEITAHDQAGEVLVQGPSVALGYLNNEKATNETFVHHEDGRWIGTGDEAMMTVAPSGNEQLVIVDRIKELIKVKGHQVAPAELEAHILLHADVADCAVIQVPDPMAGEVPKAYVVKSPNAGGKVDDEVAQSITKWVADHKASYKCVKGGVEFIEIIPKSPSGKILRRVLRDKEEEMRRKLGGNIRRIWVFARDG